MSMEFNSSRKYQNFTQQNLERFILRSRMVEEHSLAQDRAALGKLSRRVLNFNITESLSTGEKTIELAPTPLISSEQLESAAARVRPIFLFSDGIYYADALRYLYELLDSESMKAGVKSLLLEFQVADPDYPESKRNTTKAPDNYVSNKDIAAGWLYGSLLHDDVQRQTYTANMSIEKLFSEAQRTIAQKILATVNALEFIRNLVDNKSISINMEVVEMPVTVTAKEWLPGKITNIFQAPLGTAVPAPTEDLRNNPNWTEAQFGIEFNGKKE